MKEIVKGMLDELAPILKTVGATDAQLAGLLEDGLNHTAIRDALVVMKREEVARLEYAVGLVPESMWKLYAARDIRYLRECKIRREAEKALKKAFHGKVRKFARKEKKDEAGGQEAPGAGPQG